MSERKGKAKPLGAIWDNIRRLWYCIPPNTANLLREFTEYQQ